MKRRRLAEKMKFVYLVMSGNGHGQVLNVCSTEFTATNFVDNHARVKYGINPDKEPLDFTGALCRYGWADRVWWQKEVLYE